MQEERRILSIEPLDKQIIDKLASLNIYVNVVGRKDETTALLQKANPEVLICRDRDDVAEIIDNCSNIKFIFNVEVGVEELPFQKLLKKGIRVANCSGISADIMSNYAMACILGHCARLKENILNQQQHVWKRYQCTDSLQNKSLLIVGAGRTGREIARKAKIYGLKTIGVQRTPRTATYIDETIALDELDRYLPNADYVVCTIPQTPITVRLFNCSRFSLMKESSVFINISRGAIVVEDDLLNVLDEGKIAQVYLDVFEKEPLPVDHPLWSHPKVLVTPHQSGRLTNYMSRAMDIFVENYQAYIQGNIMPNEVNLKQGY